MTDLEVTTCGPKARKIGMRLKIAVLVLAASAAQAGEWKTTTSKDAMTDSVDVNVWQSSGDTRIDFMCDPDSPVVVLKFAHQLNWEGRGGSHRAEADFRIDGGKPGKLSGGVLPGNPNVLFITKVDKRFFREALTGSKLLVQALTFSHGPATGEFDLPGLADALKALPCAKKLPM